MTNTTSSPNRDGDHSSTASKDLEDKYVENVDEKAVPKTERTIKQAPGLSPEDREWLADIDEKTQRRILHKVDRHLVPMLALLYLIAHLDRANIGNAKIEGLEENLGMEGADYNIALMLFFIPYVLCEVPSNILLSKFTRPSWYIGILIVCWGTVMTFSGTTASFAGLCVTRFLIGVFEAGFFPGAVWLISQWYPPHKTQGRMAMFYLSSAASGAFSGLLAAGIAQMDGLGGYEGWRWIFIIEGIVSVLLGVLCFFILPDSPLRAKWLTRDEAKFLELTHIAFRGVKTNAKESTAKKRFDWKIFKAVITDWQLYLQAIVYWSNVGKRLPPYFFMYNGEADMQIVPNYGLKFTMPSIIQSMGFSSTTAQLLTAPPYACGAISAVVSALIADRLHWRMPFVVGFQCCLVVAFSVLFVFAPDIQNNIPLCYVMVTLACIGLYPIIPGNNTWTINNLAGPEKRAMGIAFMIMMGNSGGFAGSFIFLEEEKPRYPTGFGSSLGFATAGIIAALLLEFLYWSHNKRHEKMTEEEAIAKYGEEKLERMGDKSPLFKYAL